MYYHNNFVNKNKLRFTCQIIWISHTHNNNNNNNYMVLFRVNYTNIHPTITIILFW